MKTRSSTARVMPMKRKALEPILCHFYDDSTALVCKYSFCTVCTKVRYTALADPCFASHANSLFYKPADTPICSFPTIGCWFFTLRHFGHLS